MTDKLQQDLSEDFVVSISTKESHIVVVDKEDEKIQKQIKLILETNKIEDLKMFLSNRHRLNKCNIMMNYMFHIIQTAGILTTTIAVGYDIKILVWVGVGLNCAASLINIFEKTNITIIKKYMQDIQNIKNNNYIDESEIDFDPTPKSN